ncbi:TPA: hypothetical protein DEO28_05045 [Candidatus Dependentiae bacterium]|nr:MAG: Oxidoreductase, NAD-binding domain protein [candidate division TM6 bacterium GW2011_GWE2_31_21]KKP53919.1 MAG: Oxidoreductase, NAD-binding domain protein [candidate division TM6 bacterium GW2011_GWF2_33_332]HBS47699.1 hypothetical protein [Candidatus Dependentiae bacterium]HBZ73848.1 hypothetical protein [Candidatus Dependentiae bacterium]
MESKIKYSVAIVGLGNIGMLYDYNQPDNDNYLTHTKSFDHHADFEIKYLVDVNKEKNTLAKLRYPKAIVVDDLEKISKFPDIVVLSSIPSVNYQIFNKLKDREEIKLFVLEKPFWNSDLVYSDVKKYSKKCVVNYIRKYIPFYQQLKLNILKNIYGKPLGIHIWYSKGLRNNGSHLIDILNYLFDSVYDLESIKIINFVNDYKEQDLSISFSVKYEYKAHKFPVFFQASDERFFSLIEFDIVFEKKRFRFFDFGNQVEIYEVENDHVFSGYKNLVGKQILNIDMNKYGYHMCDYLSKLLKCEVDNFSSLDNEFQIYKLIKAVNEKVEI